MSSTTNPSGSGESDPKVKPKRIENSDTKMKSSTVTSNPTVKLDPKFKLGKLTAPAEANPAHQQLRAEQEAKIQMEKKLKAREVEEKRAAAKLAAEKKEAMEEAAMKEAAMKETAMKEAVAKSLKIMIPRSIPIAALPKDKAPPKDEVATKDEVADVNVNAVNALEHTLPEVEEAEVEEENAPDFKHSVDEDDEPRD